MARSTIMTFGEEEVSFRLQFALSFSGTELWILGGDMTAINAGSLIPRLLFWWTTASWYIGDLGARISQKQVDFCCWSFFLLSSLHWQVLQTF